MHKRNRDSIIDDTVEHIKRTARPFNDCISSAASTDVYARGLEWLEHFIMKPHPDLGRVGPICPFVQFSYSTGSLYVANVETGDLSLETFIQLMLRLPEVYRAILVENALPPTAFSLLTFFPNLDSDNCIKFIDLTHAIAKPLFMDVGLMLGEFHPTSMAKGVHSPHFHPLRSPIPAFVVRAIAPHDILFLDREHWPPAVRIHELECYLAWTNVAAEKKQRLRTRIDQIKAGAR